jgi:hypothetical protein
VCVCLGVRRGGVWGGRRAGSGGGSFPQAVQDTVATVARVLHSRQYGEHGVPQALVKGGVPTVVELRRPEDCPDTLAPGSVCDCVSTVAAWVAWERQQGLHGRRPRKPRGAPA